MAKYGPEKLLLKNATEVTLRYCRGDDASLYLPYQKQIAKDTRFTLQMDSNTPSREKVREMWEKAEKNSIELRLGAFVPEKQVAMAGLHRPGPTHPWTKHIAWFGMSVLKDYWGQGLGRRMLEILETHARKNGLRKIEGLVRSKNERATQLYKSMGYLIEGTRRNGALIDGEFLDEYYLGKLL